MENNVCMGTFEVGLKRNGIVSHADSHNQLLHGTDTVDRSRTDLWSLSQPWRSYAVTHPTICNLGPFPDPGLRLCAEIGIKKWEWGGSLASVRAGTAVWLKLRGMIVSDRADRITKTWQIPW